MLFLHFKSQKERRAIGGSCFVEISYDDGSWRDDSLYVHGGAMNVFYDRYSTIFCNGEYANGKKGVVDMWGVNYYSPEETIRIIERLQARGSINDLLLLKWLEFVEPGDGFWILGI